MVGDLQRGKLREDRKLLNNSKVFQALSDRAYALPELSLTVRGRVSRREKKKTRNVATMCSKKPGSF